MERAGAFSQPANPALTTASTSINVAGAGSEHATANTLAAGRAFIREDERPQVGRKALELADKAVETSDKPGETSDKQPEAIN